MKHSLDLHRTRRRRTFAGVPRGFHPRRRARGFGPRELGRMLFAGLIGGLAFTMLPDLADRPDGAAVTAPAAMDIVGESAAPVRASFGLCHSGGGRDCVVDGDTFWIGGEKVRIADIDTPETHPARCAREAQLGKAATRRLQALLNAGAVTLDPIDRDADRYGRKLRIVSVDGRGVGETLVAEGLARRYEGGRRAGWCDQA